MSELMTWANLGTMTGATAAVLVAVQYIKPALPMINTRMLALGLSLIILMAATAITGAPLESYGLAVFNAFLVASAAMGAYEITFEPGDAAKKLNA